MKTVEGGGRQLSSPNSNGRSVIVCEVDDGYVYLAPTCRHVSGNAVSQGGPRDNQESDDNPKCEEPHDSRSGALPAATGSAGSVVVGDLVENGEDAALAEDAALDAALDARLLRRSHRQRTTQRRTVHAAMPRRHMSRWGDAPVPGRGAVPQPRRSGSRSHADPQTPASVIVRSSAHAWIRSAQRNAPYETIAYVLQYGQEWIRTGVIFYFLGRRDIPPLDRANPCKARLEGTVVLLSGDGEVITVYRNRQALHDIRRKTKYQEPHRPHAPCGDESVLSGQDVA